MLTRSTFKRPVYTPPPKAPLRPATRRAQYRTSDAVVAAIPKTEPARSEPYRRLVAAMPCKACGIWNWSQAAHVPPDGRGIKQDDRLTFPLCATRLGITGCHVEFDNWRIFLRAAAVEQGMRWALQTQAEILAAGLWPKKLPKWTEST